MSKYEVKTLRRKDEDSLPEWVPIDPDTPSYETQGEALRAMDAYREANSNARIELCRTWDYS